LVVYAQYPFEFQNLLDDSEKLITMRVSAVVFSVLWSAASAFVPSSHHSLGVLRSASQEPVVALQAEKNDNENAVMIMLPLPVVTTLAASLFMFAPLPAQAKTAPAVEEAVVEKVSAEQQALTSAKSALDEATKQYAASSKVVKDAQALDFKAEKTVTAAESKLEKARKNFINANDVLVDAKATRKEDVISKQTKLVGMYL